MLQNSSRAVKLAGVGLSTLTTVILRFSGGRGAVTKPLVLVWKNLIIAAIYRSNPDVEPIARNRVFTGILHSQIYWIGGLLCKVDWRLQREVGKVVESSWVGRNEVFIENGIVGGHPRVYLFEIIDFNNYFYQIGPTGFYYQCVFPVLIG